MKIKKKSTFFTYLGTDALGFHANWIGIKTQPMTTRIYLSTGKVNKDFCCGSIAPLVSPSYGQEVNRYHRELEEQENQEQV